MASSAGLRSEAIARSRENLKSIDAALRAELARVEADERMLRADLATVAPEGAAAGGEVSISLPPASDDLHELDDMSATLRQYLRDDLALGRVSDVL